MKRWFAVFALVGMSIGSSFAQDATDSDAPEIEITTPPAGAGTSRSITVVGTVTDNVGVTEVRYRPKGLKKWRKAILIEEGATSTTFTFQTKLGRSSGKTRVFVRAFDAAGNESDIISRKYIVGGTNPSDEAAAATTNTGDGTDGTDTGGGIPGV